MLAALVTVFREVLEASLVVGAVAAATRSVPGRGVCLALGIASGVFISSVVALLIGWLARLANGAGQEVFNAVLAIVSVIMLTWHNVWTTRHVRVLARSVDRLGPSTCARQACVWPAGVAVAAAVAREGSEVVLFMYGLSVYALGHAFWIVGAVLGLILGVGAGFGLYLGLLRLPVRYIFSTTGIFILLLACGLAARAAHQLQQADILPSLGDKLWDTSSIVSDGSPLGVFLRSLTGYTARPSGIEVIVYIATFVITALLMLWSRRGKGWQQRHGVT